MVYLDSDDNVAKYWYEPFAIVYVSNVRSKRLRKYIPDFLVELVSGAKKLVEVKPKKRLAAAKVIKKIQAAREWCAVNNVQFEIVTEDQLKALGLL